MGAQTRTFEGRVSDSTGKAISSATIILNENDKILDYAISDSNGNFKLKRVDKDSLILIVKSLGYQTNKKRISVEDFQEKLQVVLKPKIDELDEVLIVESKNMIKESQDTITYNLNFFTDKQEQTVEDVIKKLPGMEVDDNGTIKYLNKEISKMLIDGDDLVDDKYKLLSQNLDSDVLENIQVLRNYDDNPLRKKFGKGHEVALNLTIKDNKKNILFGKFGLSGGLPKFYQINNNLGLLKEKVKLLNINEVNNIGNKLNPIPESKSVPLEDIWSSKENKDVGDFNLVKNEIREVGFLENEDYYRNESQLTSLTGSYNSKKNFSARFVSYFSNDFRFYDDQTSQRIFTSSEAINYTEANHIDQISPAFYSETELKYYDQESNYVTFEGSFSQSQEHFNQNIMLNEFLIDSDGKQRSQKYNANVRWTYQPNEGFLLENYGYFTYINRSEGYNGLNPLEEYSTSINQHTKAINTYAGLTSKLQLKKDSHLLDIVFGSELENQKRQYEINIRDFIKENQNFKYSNFLLQSGYTFKMKENSSFGLSASYTFKNSLSSYADFSLGKFGASYSFAINKLGNFVLSGNIDEDLGDWNSIYNGNYLYDYRTFNRGLNNPFKYLKKSLSLIHHDENPEEGFLIFNYISFTDFNEGIILKNIISEDFSIINRDVGRGGTSIIAQSQFTFYSDALSSSIKIDNSFNYFKNFLATNSTKILPSNNYQISSTLSTTAYLNFPLQWKSSITFQNIWSRFSGYKGELYNWIIKNKFNYSFPKNVTLSADWEFYKIARNNHNFFHSELSFKPEQSPWNFGIRARNLLNVKYLESKQITDILSVTNRIRINPARIMVFINYRF